MPLAGQGCKDMLVKHLLGTIPLSIAAVVLPVPGHYHLSVLQWCCNDSGPYFSRCWAAAVEES